MELIWLYRELNLHPRMTSPEQQALMLRSGPGCVARSTPPSGPSNQTGMASGRPTANANLHMISQVMAGLGSTLVSCPVCSKSFYAVTYERAGKSLSLAQEKTCIAIVKLYASLKTSDEESDKDCKVLQS